MFIYDPKDAKKLFEAGDYQAELTSFEEKTTKTGKPMLVVNLQVYPRGAGQSILLRDWIVNPDSIWKLKKLAQALGVSDKFENQTFDPADYTGSSVIVLLKTKTDDKYGEQNTVVGYKPFAESIAESKPFTSSLQESPGKEPVFAESKGDEDIPF